MKQRLAEEKNTIAAECQDLKAEGAIHEAEIRVLNHEELIWADRDFIVAAVKRPGYTNFRCVNDTSMQMKYAWGLFYKQLAYRYHISLRHRSIDQTTSKPMKSGSPCLNVLREDELPKAVATIVALCNQKGVSLADMIRRLSDPSIAYDPYYIDPNPMRDYNMDDDALTLSGVPRPLPN